MAIDAINSSQAATATNSTTKTNSTLAMDDFFKLMVAQLQNQDMNNPVDSTEYTSQMAQFSMVQALADLSEASKTSYSVSLIGKEVTLAETKDDGSINTITGTVDGVNLYNGDAEILVNGIKYPISSIMEVNKEKESSTVA
ncbi:flagellar hook assembly protein FlgD [Acetobacterium sp.]|uniref:flagellar hook assembly protein FlgD n=1 Tax=Acetobacterium sp. TaxID=1872094 RepID=UPI002F3FD2EC